MTPSETYKKIERELPKLLKEYVQKSKQDFLTELDLQFVKPPESKIFRNLKTRASIRPNTGKKLRLITGALLDSYDPKDDNSASEVKYTNDSFVSTYKSKLPYAKVHEFGGGDIPKRPYVRPATEEYEKGEQELLEWLLEEIRKIADGR